MEQGRSRLVPFLKGAVSCFVILLGLLLGILGVALAAGMPVFSGDIEWYRVAGVAMLGFIALLASTIAIRSRRYAGLLFLIAAPAIGACFAWWQRLGPYDVSVSVSRLFLVFTGTSLLFVIPGVFWLVTSRAGWPLVISVGSMPSKRIHWPDFLGVLLFVICTGVGVFVSICAPPPPGESCGGLGPPVSVQRFPDQVVFTANLLFVGRSFDSMPGYAYWSVVRVHRRFWGMPSWAPGFVVLRGVFKKGETGEYFVDGRRGRGLLTHFLPVVEHYSCCHMEPLDLAAADLRALQDGPPKSGVRILGRVYTDMYVTSEPARGVKMLIAGPGGNITTTTDQQGIYDLIGLPAGHYSVQVEPKDQCDYFCRAEGDVKSGEVWGATLVARLSQPSTR